MSDKLFRISTPTIKYTIDDEFDMSRVASSRFIICNMGNKNRIVKENPTIEGMAFRTDLTQEETKKLNAGIISAQIHILLNNHKVIWTDIAKTTMNGVLGEDMFDVPDYSADTGEYEIDFHGTVSDYDVPLHGHLDVTLEGSTVIPNPVGEATDDLTKVEIDGEIFLVKDSTIHDWARAEEKPTYTKTEVGLGNVDNTSDIDKPISTATQTALDGKVNKDGNKVLSDNNYSDTDKSIVGGVTSALANKVDKVEGYGLSKNDYTDEEKAKVGEIDNKLDKTETAVNSNGLVIATPVTDTAPYIYRQTPVKESFKALMKKIVGASVVWNQIVQNGNFSDDSVWRVQGGTITGIQNNIMSVKFDGTTAQQQVINPFGYTPESTHKYFSTIDVKLNDVNGKIGFLGGKQRSIKDSSATTDWQKLSSVWTGSTYSYYIIRNITPSLELEAQFKNAMCLDLTAMFGTTIADYVHTLETSQSGSGIAWLQSYGFFTEDYYAYKQNKLESGCVSAHKTYDGETLLTNTELSPITLRGLFKLSTDKLTVDGDEYNADGSVTRKYGIVDLGSLDWTMSTLDRWNTTGLRNLIKKPSDLSEKADIVAEQYKTVSSNDLSGDTTLIGIECNIYGDVKVRNGSTTEKPHGKIAYKLATPITEQTTPFTETEIVGSTEEFIDYEVAQGNRDVAIPVGTETDYYQEMKLPSLPTTSGNHNLIYNIATGFGWS